MAIHPSAIIGKNVVLGKDNDIGPNVVIEDGAVIGSNNKFWPGVFIARGTTIGDSNQIHMGTIIGHEPQDLAYQSALTGTKIGNKNVIREYVTIHRGTKEGTNTVIGDQNYLMLNSHIAHNCQIGNNVIMVNGVGLAGYCVVEDQAFLSGMTAYHQFSRIGRLAMVSALSAINRDIPPFMMCGGRGAVVHGINLVGMKRAGISEKSRNEIKEAYKILYRSGLNTSNALSEIERTCQSAEIKHLVEFIKNSKRGIAKASENESDDLRF